MRGHLGRPLSRRLVYHLRAATAILPSAPTSGLRRGRACPRRARDVPSDRVGGTLMTGCADSRSHTRASRRCGNYVGGGCPPAQDSSSRWSRKGFDPCGIRRRELLLEASSPANEKRRTEPQAPPFQEIIEEVPAWFVRDVDIHRSVEWRWSQ